MVRRKNSKSFDLLVNQACKKQEYNQTCVQQPPLGPWDPKIDSWSLFRGSFVL
jgi:hypothetical protein